MITRVLLGAATRRRDILLCFHPAFPLQLPPFPPSLSSRLHQSRPVLNITSTNVRLFFYFCSFFLFLSFLFFIDGGTDGVRTCFLFLRTAPASSTESRDEIKVEGDLCEKERAWKCWVFAFCTLICRCAEIYAMYKITCLN